MNISDTIFIECHHICQLPISFMQLHPRKVRMVCMEGVTYCELCINRNSTEIDRLLDFCAQHSEVKTCQIVGCELWRCHWHLNRAQANRTSTVHLTTYTYRFEISKQDLVTFYCPFQVSHSSGASSETSAA